MRSALGGIVSLAILVIAPGAEAAQRYAAVGGGGTACTQAAPCALIEAVTKAQDNDEVIVGAGTYLLPAAIATPPGSEKVTVHGDPAGSLPRITGSAPNPLLSAPEQGSRVEYLEVENRSNQGAAFFCGPGGRIERVVAKTVGNGSIGIPQINDCVINDSLIRVDGLEAQGIYANSYEAKVGTTRFRNLTVIATGTSSVGLRVNYSDFLNSGSYTVDLRNSIVDGGTIDLLTSSGLKGPGRISAANSSFDVIKQEAETAIVDAGGNQTAPPLFVNAAAGDYREAAGSPTIDAGAGGDPGALDLAGNPRAIGAAPDIGAYEFVPPAAPAVAGTIQSLSLRPAKFRVGGATAGIKDKVARARGTTVTYALSGPAAVTFAVQRKLSGRRAGKKCVKRTRANKGKKSCPLYRPVKGSFGHSGVAGANSFAFSGMVGGRALRQGAYRLTGTTGATALSAAFKVLK